MLPIFYIAATEHSMPGAAHLTSRNSAQCKTFSSPCTFIYCCSMTECLRDSANSDRFCCYIPQKKRPEYPPCFKKEKTEQPAPPNMTVHSQHRICNAREKNDNIYITFSHIVVVSQKAVVNFPCVRVLAHLQQDYSACLSAVD